MYVMFLSVCLVAFAPECIEVTEDPVIYYNTQKECAVAMERVSKIILDTFAEDSGEMVGYCKYVSNIKTL
jgi:hypothetical protein